jgi:hypothetical protein
VGAAGTRDEERGHEHDREQQDPPERPIA